MASLSEEATMAANIMRRTLLMSNTNAEGVEAAGFVSIVLFINPIKLNK